MKSENHANALLVELLIVIFFFMIGSAITVQVFEKSYHQGKIAQNGIVALSQAQNVADILYQTEDARAELEAMGFTESEDDGWVLWNDEYKLTVNLDTEETTSGVFRRAEIKAMMGKEELLRLPSTRYVGRK